jgi:HPt (histidine-containing phosphotransfer) domain-containing protein
MINWSQIKQLEEDVGAEDLAEVVTLFLSEVDEAIEGLETVASGTTKEVAEALHFLKGSAFNSGFQEFGDYCSIGESQAHAGDTSEISMSQVEKLYVASKAQFLAELPNHCAVEL